MARDLPAIRPMRLEPLRKKDIKCTGVSHADGCLAIRAKAVPRLALDQMRKWGSSATTASVDDRSHKEEILTVSDSLDRWHGASL